MFSKKEFQILKKNLKLWRNKMREKTAGLVSMVIKCMKELGSMSSKTATEN